MTASPNLAPRVALIAVLGDSLYRRPRDARGMGKLRVKRSAPGNAA